MPLNTRTLKSALGAFALALNFALGALAAPPAPIPVKVVVVTMFQIGKLTDDKPGEAHLWVERQKLDRVLPFPLGEYELRMNDAGLLLICTGGGVTNSSSSIMALGLDPRFDLSHAYWLVAGIAGGDPLDVSLGTAAWAKHVVDGDLLYEIDAREIPPDWPYGMLPLGAKKPNDIAGGWTVDTIHYALNAALVDWAYSLTKDHPVADTPAHRRIPPAIRGLSCRDAAALRHHRRLAVLQQVLAWRAHESVGERLGEIAGRQGCQFHDGEHGRQRHADRAASIVPRRTGGPETRAGAAHGE